MDQEYSSVKVLPVIGQESSAERRAAGGTEEQKLRIHSRVELTRKEVQNFLVNGKVSKEFIASNKKEIQQFIRNQARTADQGFKGYETYA